MLIRAFIRTMGSMNIGILTLTEAVIGPGIAGEKGMSGMKAGKAAVGADATNMADQEVLYSPSRLACPRAICPSMQPWRGAVRSTLAEG